MTVGNEARFSSSSFCSGGHCVEVAPLSNGAVAVRDPRYPRQPSLLFTAEEWADFVRGVKAGEFDPPQASTSS
jgi:Domain of unknown function (DUF397)